MWARLFFPVRRFLLDIGGHLGSWRLSIVLMVAAALYYTFLAVWATSSPPHVVQNIASLAPFWVVYGLLLINTGVCLWRRLPRLRRETSVDPVMYERQPEWEVPVTASSPDGTVTVEIDGQHVGVGAFASERILVTQ